MQYDYLLVVGPGRSGSEFLYENLKRHPAVAFPEIKESYYYRSLQGFHKARRRVSGSNGAGKILADIANLAYQDPLLPKGVAGLRSAGISVLIVVLLRDHCDRARSMIRYRQSRGYLSAWQGQGKLQDSVIRDRLQPEQLTRIYGLGADVLTIAFPALVNDTATTLGILTSRCGISEPDAVVHRAVNASVAARFSLLSAAGKSAAVLLRKLGFKSLLQSLKDRPALQNLFFKPLPPGAAAPTLSPAHAQALAITRRECLSVIQRHSRPLANNIYFHNGGGEQ